MFHDAVFCVDVDNVSPSILVANEEDKNIHERRPRSAQGSHQLLQRSRWSESLFVKNVLLMDAQSGGKLNLPLR